MEGDIWCEKENIHFIMFSIDNNINGMWSKKRRSDSYGCAT